MADFKIQLKDRQGNFLFPKVKLANAINDADFITATQVSTTYATKSELAEIISSKLSREVVTELPTEEIKTNTIYMVPNAGSEAQNVYDEYLYVNGSWELIGTTATDLTGYATETYVDTAVSDAKAELETYIGSQGFATETYTDTAVSDAKTELKGYVDSEISDAKTELEGYVDNAVSDAISDVETYVNTNFAPINNAALTGIPTVPDLESNAGGTQIANKNYVESYVNNMFLLQNLVYVVLSDSL